MVVARLTSTLKRAAAGSCRWRKIDEHIEAGEFAERLAGWSCERRFVVIRERVREGRAAVGRRLIDVPGYTYRIFVTNRSEAPELIWRDYNLRATLEQRIDELKSDLGADDFCRREFYATEAAFRSVLLLFNLLSLWQTAARPPCAPRSSSAAPSPPPTAAPPCSTSAAHGAVSNNASR